MQTTKQWWESVSQNPEKMIEWLKKQYHGEVTAEKRIRNLITQYSLDGKQEFLITQIADQEKRHAEWVKQLLMSRGIEPEILDKEERYWDQTLPNASEMSFEAICAVGHLAENMRLERITLLADDDQFADIGEVFARILPDEKFHTRAFAAMSTPEHIEAARTNHMKGMNAIGLVD